MIVLGSFVPGVLSIENTQQFDHFSQWCEHRETRETQEQKTVEVLLQSIGTSDCEAATDRLETLTELYLENQQISDLSPLETLPQLQVLYLSNNQISDLQPLSVLTQLQKLYLNGNQISDLRPLSPLNHLNLLYLDDNQIADLTPLSQLSQLTELYLSGNQIVHLDPLANLTQLTGLYLWKNQIYDIQALSQLTQLSRLNLGDNRITTIEPLRPLKQLVQLDLDDNQITELDPLSALSKLTAIDLRNNPIAAKICPILPATICLFSDDAAELYDRAQAQYERGNLLTAIATFQEALEIYRNSQDRLREGDTLDRLGRIHSDLGQYPQALELYQQAAIHRQELGDRQGESETLTSLGITFARLGQYDRARSSLERAWEIYQSLEIWQKSGLRPEPQEGILFDSLALVYDKLGKASQALRFAKQALASYRRGGDRYGEATALNRVGEAYLRVGNPERGLMFLEKARNLTREIRDLSGEARSLDSIGEVYASQGKAKTALEFYQQALIRRRAVGDIAGEGTTLNHLGALFLQTGQLAEATETLQKTIEVWESLRPGLTDESKISIADTQATTYRLLQQALIARGEKEAALEIAERGRARAFVELLAIRLRDDADFSHQLEPPTIDQIRQIARSQNATLVEYSIVEDELYIWVVQPHGQIEFQRSNFKTRIGGLTLSEFVTASRNHMGVRSAIEIVLESKPPTIELQGETLQQLHQLLIEPIADWLPSNPEDRTIFIPQGSLFLVPFPALQDAKGAYLIEQHTLLTAPAIQLLQFGSSRVGAVNDAVAPPSSSPEDILVVGNPTMPSISVDIDRPAVQLPPLPGAQQEAIAIAELLGTTALTGDRATKSAVVSQLPTARLVHLATHGLLEDFESGVPGALALAPDAGSSSKDGQGTIDGLLTAGEILNLNLNAELVVLSACDTGRGNITGDGVIGLSRSFLTAGVPAVVVSLWSVGDNSTQTLMVEFYRQMQHNPDRSQALRQAILTTMAQYPDPIDWAAFAFIGEPEGDRASDSTHPKIMQKVARMPIFY
jgi:CHAT domain-containing protein/Tfp pilus assembly protein PilF